MGRIRPPKLTRAHAAAVVAELRKLTPRERRRMRLGGYASVSSEWRFWAGALSPLGAIIAFGFLMPHMHGAKAVIGLVFGAEAFAVGGLAVALLTIRSLGLRVMSLQFPNLCKTCGYDLTGNTTGVCSECGASIVNPVNTAKPASQPTF